MNAAVSHDVRGAIADLLAEYGLLIDADRLEDWVDLFKEECDYRIVTRENIEQGLPNILMWCRNRAMLRDRIESYRQVNEYNLHWDRHVIGPPRITPEAQTGRWRVEVGYSLFQTDLEGESRLFSVGRYEASIAIEKDEARIVAMLIVADTGSVPTLLATPI